MTTHPLTRPEHRERSLFFRATALTLLIAAIAALFAGNTASAAMVAYPAQPARAALTYTVVDSDNDPYSGIYLRDDTRMAAVNRVPSRYMLYGAQVDLICGTNGEAVGPYANRRWHSVTVRTGSTAGQTGWIADRYLNTPNKANQPTPGEAECGQAGAPPTTAPSATSGTYISKAAPLYLCVNTANKGCLPTGMPSVSSGQKATMLCWQDGSTATGDYTTNRWFWVSGSFGEGFVTASVVRNQTNVPACATMKRFVAADAAVARNGQQQASTSDTATFISGTNNEWKPGPNGEWAGDCPKLPAIGWLAAGVTIPRKNAIKNYATWKGQGKIQSGVPPRGAVVFYDIAKPLGHTAISLGNGYIVTTQGLDWSNKANTVMLYTGYSNYLGYVMPG